MAAHHLIRTLLSHEPVGSMPALVMSSTPTDLDASFVIVDSDGKPKQQQHLSQVGDVSSNLQAAH